jgi:hypothetical protein
MSASERKSALCVNNDGHSYTFLTPIRGWVYHFFVKGGIDSELNEGKIVQRKKGKSYPFPAPRPETSRSPRG